MRDSRELARVTAEARAIAAEAGQPPTSAHLLLALFTFPNPAERVLRARRVDDQILLSRLRELPRESAEVVDQLVERAREVAKGTGSSDARALHLLIALARAKGTTANDLLGQLVTSTADLAKEALSYVVGPLPRRFVPPEEEAVKAPARALASTPPRARAATRPTPASAPPKPASRVSVIDAPSSAPVDATRESRLSKIRRLAQGLDADAPASPFSLSPEEFPYLTSIGRNLTELALSGRVDPVVGREREVSEVLDVLGKRRANNPVLLGEPGVGKTAVVEGVALELVEKAQGGDAARIIVELDVAGLVAGTELRGSLSEKLSGIKEEVRRANGRVVVFIDEIHMLVGAGQTGEGAQDAGNELKAALARGELPCIGATTFAEFQRYFAQDPALERRFVPIRVDEPTVAEAIEILRGVAPRYAAHHQVTYDDEAIVAAARLSARFVRDRALPDKAVAALDFAGSRAARAGSKTVTRDEVARAVARMARLPEERLLVSDAERMLGLEEQLSARVIGHRASVERIAQVVRRNFAGFSGQRPLASFLLLGPTGVGKTELAKSLAEVVFGETNALVRIDMSELSEPHAVARLVGAPPGYVGFGEGGLLTEAVRRQPAAVLLLDELEKAHRDSQALVLQLLDEGHLTDGRGRRVDFTSCIVVMTSNLGARAFEEREGRQVGFGQAAAASTSGRVDRALAMAREELLPELWNRIDERLVFEPLTRDDLRRIARLVADKSSARLEEDKRIRFSLDDGAVEYLLDHGGFDPLLGARPMRQAIARHVEAPLADRILRELVQPGDRLSVVVRAGKLDFEHLTIIEPALRPAAEAT